MKYIKWLIRSLIVSVVLLFVVNICGRYININIPINIYTILIAAIFKIPGVIVLIIFYLL
jgi:inhibitor of the pro-sigma K processing machinery